MEFNAKYIANGSVLTDDQKKEFEEKYELTSDEQKTYGQIVLRLMEKKKLNSKKAGELTGLNKRLFDHLDEPGGSIQKRFVVSIGVGFGLDCKATEYLLESCGMRFNLNDRVDKAYIHLLEEHKGEDIDTCNAILRDLNIEGKDMLGELERGANRR